MKNFKTISKRLVLGICAACTFTIMLSSCLKDHTSDTPTPPVSLLSVIQASPGLGPVNFTLDGTVVNTSTLNYGNSIDYFRAYSGNRKVSFKTALNGTQVAADTVSLAQNVAYSLILANKSTTPEILFLTDSLKQPLSGNGSIRFINLSPDAPKVDLAIKDGSVLVANEPFNGASSFIPIPGKTYNFEVRLAGTSTVVASTTATTINNGYIYTIYLQGLMSSTDASTKPSVNVITNAYYLN